MARLDWIFLALLMLSMVVGAWRGLAYEVVSLASWLGAFVLAQWLAPDAAAHLPLNGMSESLRYAAGFVLVFVVAVFAGGMLAFALSKLLTVVGLRPMDRVLGAGFGLLRGALVVLAIALVVGLTPWQSAPVWHESRAAQWSGMVLSALRPVLPDAVAKFIP